MDLTLPIGLQNYFLACFKKPQKFFELMVAALHWIILKQSYLRVLITDAEYLVETLTDLENIIKHHETGAKSLELQYQHYKLGESLIVRFTEVSKDTSFAAEFETADGGKDSYGLDYIYPFSSSMIVPLIFNIEQFNDLASKISTLVDKLRKKYILPGLLKKMQSQELFPYLANAIDTLLLKYGCISRTAEGALINPNTLDIVPQTKFATVRVDYEIEGHINQYFNFRMVEEETGQIKIILSSLNHTSFFCVKEEDIIRNKAATTVREIYHQPYVLKIEEHIIKVLNLIKSL